MAISGKFPKKSQLAVMSAVGLLAVGLAATTLAPTYGLNEDPGLSVTIPCVTRSVNAGITGGNWRSQTVCQAGEFAMSAGGFCSAAGNMVGVSTTANTTDRNVWLWCTGSGTAYWYAMCCDA